MLLPSAWQTLISNGHTILAFSPDLVLQNSKWRMSPVSGRLNTFNILDTFSIIVPPLYPPESGNTPRPWSKMGPQLLHQYGTQHLLYLSPGYCTAKKNDIYKWNLWECWRFSKISTIIWQNENKNTGIWYFWDLLRINFLVSGSRAFPRAKPLALGLGICPDSHAANGWSCWCSGQYSHAQVWPILFQIPSKTCHIFVNTCLECPFLVWWDCTKFPFSGGQPKPHCLVLSSSNAPG